MAFNLPTMNESGTIRQWPQRLYHKLPGWVKDGAIFHLRLRMDEESAHALIKADLAQGLLVAAENYHVRSEWHCMVFLVMPDHIHTLVAFPYGKPMSTVVGSWKRYVARSYGLRWQVNFFDHRIRHTKELHETWVYILRNPVAKGLCDRESDWPWVWYPRD